MPYAPLTISQHDVTYAYGPDSFPRVGVPAGRTEELRLIDSVHFPGTRRRVWVHVPVGVDDAPELAVMLFNDGWWYLDPQGDVRAAVVLDNLVASGEIPPMIGVFVDPGMFSDSRSERKNRNAEYDAFDDTYASFLIEEVLPLLGARYPISADPRARGICGGSSGGNGAFTAAWSRPDGIGRVIAFNPSFAQMPGGNPYPRLLDAGAQCAFRVFLQAAHRDIGWNSRNGNWFAECLETGAALARAGADIRLVVGDGGHSPVHGGALLPDCLRWLWA